MYTTLFIQKTNRTFLIFNQNKQKTLKSELVLVKKLLLEKIPI